MRRVAGPLRARPAFQPTDPMSTLRALLLTDVVDSTKLTEALGDAAMADLWIAHDRAARDLLPTWRGREIDKTDGMLLLFDSAADAVGYALAYHRALAALKLPFSARAGIHVGPVSLRANSADDIARGAKPVEVDGLALPIAARVMSIALGRQTLLSTDARLALGVTPERVQSHGHWRLQGVVEPVELFEIGAADAPFAAPPDAGKAYRVVRQGELWQPVRQIKHSLPAERDSFVGRQEPLLALAKKLEDGARLVSVLGMGGTGKTRLVTRFAWSWLGEFPGGVWFCDLSQARTVDGIHFAVAQGLDVPLGKTDPVLQLAHAIAGRGKCLVILDNFEQVARFAEQTLGRWLDRAPLARFVVTTREMLGIVGEETLALEPLDAVDGADLFLRRAIAARADYAPQTAEHRLITELVKVLDGLPLAIELAAARIRVMPLHVLSERMSSRFDVLRSRSGRRDRQATLRAAFDWSWELLSGTERSTLAQLSVFEGGFTLEAAEMVVKPAGATSSTPIVDLVQGLADKSLIRTLADARFDLLQSVRAYAAEQLGEPDSALASESFASRNTHRRHCVYFAAADERRAVAHKCADANNLVAACRAAIAAAEPRLSAGCLRAAWFALRLTGRLRVALELATAATLLPDLSPEEFATACWIAGCAARTLGDRSAAIGHIERGITVWRSARLLLEHGLLQSDAGLSAQSLGSLTEALALAVASHDLVLESTTEIAIGRVVEHQGNLDEARQHYVNALSLARRTGDRRLEGGVLGNLGGLHLARGQHAMARDHYDQALSIADEVGDRRWEGSARSNLGLLCQELGAADQAFDHFSRALEIAKETGDIRLEYVLQCNLGIFFGKQSEPAKAIEYLEAAAQSAQSNNDLRSEGQFRGYLAVALARLARCTDATRAWNTANALLSTVSDRLSTAILTSQGAELQLLCGNAVNAATLIDQATSEAQELRVEAGSELASAIDDIKERLRAQNTGA